MTCAKIYQIFQKIFPDLATQNIPTAHPEYFGEFFEWINLNATYLQALDLSAYRYHGFEDNALFQKLDIPYDQLDTLLQNKIRIFQKQNQYCAQMMHQEILRLIICTLHDFLQQHGLDLMIIQLKQQAYWLSYPITEVNNRSELMYHLKSDFSTDLPVHILDPKHMALFC